MIDEELKERILSDITETPYYQLLQMETVELQEGRAKIKFEVDSKLTNFYQILHGGAMASLADTAMGVAIRTVNQKAVTVNFSIDYLRAGKIKDIIIAEGKLKKQGENIIFAEAELYELESNKVIARAKGTFMVQEQIKKTTSNQND